ncbi:unnamed protein product [Rhizophagus irregularis]|nr:unnamed protein product [Rhizophagus irregularis]CAB5372992.1 unnamed protein product [Rhizophagus irregularis]
MSGVIPYVVGWSAFGFAVRVVALAIQQRPLLDKPATHALSTVFFGEEGGENTKKPKQENMQLLHKMIIFDVYENNLI